LVDDDSGVREVTARHLVLAGFAVLAAADREAALAAISQLAAEEKPLAAVLIDQQLGGAGGPVDGWQLATEMRQRLSGSAVRVPLVLMSVLRKTFDPSPRYPVQLFQGFVDKPMNPRRLVEYLVKGLSGQWLAPEPVNSGATPSFGASRKPVKAVRILVAEDHDVNRQLFQLLLTRLGHETLLVENGRLALDQVQAFNPQLVFMDLQMPEMNGYESAAAMRKKGVAVPIIAVTASAVKGELERCQASGMNGILTKPFTLEVLDDAIRSFAPHLVLGPDAVQPTQAFATPRFSINQALAVFLGNRELLVSLLARFVPRTRETLDQLTQARERSDWAQVAALAHAIKGSSYNLTAKPLGDAAHALELAGKQADSAECTALEPVLRAAFDAFVAEISPLLPQSLP
jgi:CheY-like chemotaxis protein